MPLFHQNHLWNQCYSSTNNALNVSLCLDFFDWTRFFLSGTTRLPGTVPIAARDMALTRVTLESFFFFIFAMIRNISDMLKLLVPSG